MNATASIVVYAPDGNTRVIVDVMKGDQVEYKRQGVAGSLRFPVVFIGGNRITLEGNRGNFSIPTSSRNFLAVYRDGRRLDGAPVASPARKQTAAEADIALALSKFQGHAAACPSCQRYMQLGGGTHRLGLLCLEGSVLFKDHAHMVVKTESARRAARQRRARAAADAHTPVLT